MLKSLCTCGKKHLGATPLPKMKKSWMFWLMSEGPPSPQPRKTSVAGLAQVVSSSSNDTGV
eukprot:3432608-Prorocentrum_lima.AAC.1